MKTVIGLSGGVDSALAARLLLQEGHELTGVFLNIGGSDEAAVQTSKELGIPLEKIDVRSELDELVCRPFIDAYVSGRTPNPCIICNPLVKFPALLAAADRLGAERIATGHYARVEKRGSFYRLLAANSSNDQSYMLCMLGQDVLSRLILPLGSLEKTDSRRLAAEASLSSSKRPDSMEICFVPDGDYAAYIEKNCGRLPEGSFVDAEGSVLGRHLGIHHYTVGQRRGLGVSSGGRLYVSKIDPEKNTVLLTDESGLMTESFTTWAPHWIVEKPELPLRCEVRVRHAKVLAPATVCANGTGLIVKYDKSTRKPAPGQTAAFYLNGEVLGGAEIIE